MRKEKIEMWVCRLGILSLLIIITGIFSFDFFLHQGEPATFDGPTHLANIAHFHDSLSQGEFPVRWTDGFANYGLPLGLMAQQTTSYLGGFLTFITHSVVYSYVWVVIISTFLSAFMMFWFLRLWFDRLSSSIGTILFVFAPYRILNIYIRGALPEYAVPACILCILVAFTYLYKSQYRKGSFLMVVGTTSLLLTHPMMAVVSLFILVPYIALILLLENNIQKRVKTVFCIILGGLIGIGLASYYVLPLLLENKYFYYGLSPNHFSSNQWLSFEHIFMERWNYFYKGDIFTRGHILQLGVLEVLILISSLFVLIYQKAKKVSIHPLFIFGLISSIVMIFFMTQWSVFLYSSISLLGSFQHQWRILTVFQLIPPILFLVLVSKLQYRLRVIIFLSLIIVLAVLRFPQIYGKNYTVFPESYYYFQKENLHGVVMNTIWTGKAEDYPVQKSKPQFIEGKGSIVQKIVKNSKREYRVTAETPARLVDYTFYFPGWRVWIDKQPTEIEFQDPNYRGVITYRVSKGVHEVVIEFGYTKWQLLGLGLSTMTVFSLLIYGVVRVIKKS